MTALTVDCVKSFFLAILSTSSFFLIVAISLPSHEIVLKLLGTVYAGDCIDANDLSRRTFGGIAAMAIRIFSERIGPIFVGR